MDHWEEWQKVYLHGTFVIWPPDDVREIINRQRYEYDPKSASICETHITLTQPLLKPLSKEDWNRIQEISSNIIPFEIQYGPLKSFLPYPCIWYEIQPVKIILDLRNLDYDKKLNFERSISYTSDPATLKSSQSFRFPNLPEIVFFQGNSHGNIF